MSKLKLPQRIRDIYPFESHWSSVDGYELHYVDEGEREFGKPVVVLLHGNPTWSFLYREIIPQLRPQLRVIAPDYLGMGLSDKPLQESEYTFEKHAARFEMFMEKLRLRKVFLVVQDWGGPIGFNYAINNPKKVAGMLVMNTWAWPDPSVFHNSIFPWRMLHAPIIGAHVFLRSNALIERGLYLSTHDREKLRSGPVIDGYRYPFSQSWNRVPMLAFPRNIPLKPGDTNWERFAEMEKMLVSLKFPVRLLWGEKDVVFPPENAARFQRLLPDCSEPRMIEKGMHFIQEDAPAEIAEEILKLTGKG